MLNNRKETIAKMDLADNGDVPKFAPKAKGTVINSVPTINPVLKGLAYNKRKKFKLG